MAPMARGGVPQLFTGFQFTGHLRNEVDLGKKGQPKQPEGLPGRHGAHGFAAFRLSYPRPGKLSPPRNLSPPGDGKLSGSPTEVVTRPVEPKLSSVFFGKCPVRKLSGAPVRPKFSPPKLGLR